jgi:hypothetical protein
MISSKGLYFTMASGFKISIMGMAYLPTAMAQPTMVNGLTILNMGRVNRLFGLICRKNISSNTKASGKLVRSMVKAPGTSAMEQRTKENGRMTNITDSELRLARKEALDMKANG